MKREVEKWRPFRHPDDDIHDLSLLDVHQAIYIQHHEGKEPLEYRFWITYSLRCFIKDYEHQTGKKKQSLMYHAPKESRPLCQHRYNLACTYLKRTTSMLPEGSVIHAGYGSYAVIKMDLDGGDKTFYFVAFRAFRERKKLRLHITSVYPVSEGQKDKSVKFFIIAYNLLRDKQLPQPSK